MLGLYWSISSNSIFIYSHNSKTHPRPCHSPSKVWQINDLEIWMKFQSHSSMVNRLSNLLMNLLCKHFIAYWIMLRCHNGLLLLPVWCGVFIELIYFAWIFCSRFTIQCYAGVCIVFYFLYYSLFRKIIKNGYFPWYPETFDHRWQI